MNTLRITRLKLTAWYLLIIMVISFIFSGIIYRTLSTEVERFGAEQRVRVERFIHDEESYFFLPPLPVPVVNQDLINETKNRILYRLIILNTSIFILAGFFGYILSGRTLSPINDMMEEQKRFVSDASHELKTPLTSLKTAFEVFLRDKNSTIKDANLLVKESIGEVDRLKTLSDSLLLLSHGQIKNMQTDFSQVNLKEIIESAILKINPIAKKQNINIFAKLLDEKFYGNKKSLIQLMIIVLDNAVKYSNKNSRIEVILSKNNKNIFITIQDFGIGIKKDELPHIFERFYRADSARVKSGSGGYGLGLSIARQIVQNHHGELIVKSSYKKGTVVQIFFDKLTLNS